MGEAFTSYSVDNDGQFRNAITRAQAFSDDLRVPFTLIAADFYKSEQAIFALKGPGQYPPFKNSEGVQSLGGKGNEFGRRRAYVTTALSPYQKKKIKKYGFDYPLLVATGRLATSLLSPGSPGNVTNIGPTELTMGTTVPYGIYHQSDQPRKKIPLRKFLFIGPESTFANSDQQGRLERWLGIMQDAINKGMKDTGMFSDA